MTDRLKFQLETEQRLRQAIGEELWQSYPNWAIKKGGRMEKRRDPELEREIKETLRNILSFVGAPAKYADYAQLISLVENLIKRNR